LVGRVLYLAFGFALAACSGSAATYTSDADRGSTHAIVSVERREVLGAPQAAQAKAFASFVRTPPDVDVALVTRLAGLDLGLPEAGDCSHVDSATNPASGASSPLRRVELLSAGDVALETTEGRVELAPRAFPGVSDLVAGVVYTTRDRAAALPVGVAYAVNVAGSSSLSALAVSAEAPAALESVTLGGAPLGAASALNNQGTELTWRAGSARDLVYVTLAGSDAKTTTCTFRDDAGRAFLPASIIPETGPVSLSVHRLRSVAFTGSGASGIDAGELRFDFELSANLAVSSP
jgi:hypothetical protein